MPPEPSGEKLSIYIHLQANLSSNKNKHCPNFLSLLFSALNLLARACQPLRNYVWDGHFITMPIIFSCWEITEGI